MNDLISRQAALDWLKNEWNGMVTSLFDGIKALPSAQPKSANELVEPVQNAPNDDFISRKAAIDAVHRSEALDRAFGYGHAVDALRELPSAQSDAKDINVPIKDCISRQAAIAIAKDLLIHLEEYHQYNQAINNYCAEICELPSAQPELPEWAQKVEEYRKSAPSFVRNQLVWALYQTWKEYDGRLVHQREKENR